MRLADLTVVEIFPVLELLCLSLRPPGTGNHLNLSFARYCIERYESQQNPDSPGPGRRLTMTLANKPLHEIGQGSCWQGLFDSCNIVQPLPFMLSWKALRSPGKKAKHIALGSKGFGHGLEMSFDLMVSLAAVEYPLVIDGGVVLIGYESAIVPTAVSDQGNAAQFHLIMGADGDDNDEGRNTMFNPYKAGLGRCDRFLTRDLEQFRSMRCFLGWCASAQLNLGTRHLPALVQYSGARETSKSAALDGVQTLFQLGLNPAGPLSATLGVQANYRFISHRRCFTPFGGYCSLLRETAAKTVALYDAAKRRAWLVPMLSLLLHMAHAYVLNSVDGHADEVPLVDAHADATELIAVLEPLGERPILGHSNGTTSTAPDHVLLLRQLLLGLRTNLLSTTELTKPSTPRTLHGFEFMDVVTAPDRGACMKTLELSSAGQAWFPIVNAADAVVICANIGEVITPAASAMPRRSGKCDNLREGSDYLAVTVLCLNRIARRRGSELPLAPPTSLVSSNGAVQAIHPRENLNWSRIRISDDSFWELRGDPFASCRHGPGGGRGGETCWEREDLIQCVMSHSAVDALVRKMKMLGKAPPVMTAVCLQQPIPPSGALVFGR